MITDGDRVTVGNPTVADAVVVAEVVEHGRGKKVINFKYKAKVRYRRKRGHRQGFTKLAVREIRIGGEAAAPARRRSRVVETPPAEADDAEIDAEDIVNATLVDAEPSTQPDETPSRPARRGGRVVDTPPVEGDDAEIDAEDIVNATLGEPGETTETTDESPAPPRRRRRGSEGSSESQD